MGYSKAPEQPQSSARPVCHSHAMTRSGRGVNAPFGTIVVSNPCGKFHVAIASFS